MAFDTHTEVRANSIVVVRCVEERRGAQRLSPYSAAEPVHPMSASKKVIQEKGRGYQMCILCTHAHIMMPLHCCSLSYGIGILIIGMGRGGLPPALGVPWTLLLLENIFLQVYQTRGLETITTYAHTIYQKCIVCTHAHILIPLSCCCFS